MWETSEVVIAKQQSQHLYTRFIRRKSCRCLDFVLAPRMYRFEDGKPLTAPSRLTHILLAVCRTNVGRSNFSVLGIFGGKGLIHRNLKKKRDAKNRPRECALRLRPRAHA
jgi:hypothetical protein